MMLGTATSPQRKLGLPLFSRVPATPACVDWFLPAGGAGPFQLIPRGPRCGATCDSGLVERGSTHSNYYDVLGVTPTAEPVTISAAYRALIKKYHPDRNAGDAEAIRRTRLLNEAYEVLCDPEARGRYDALTISRHARELDGKARPQRTPRALSSAAFIAKILGSIAALAVLGLVISWLVRAPAQNEARAPVGRSASAGVGDPAPRARRPQKTPRMPPLTTAFLAGSWAPTKADCSSGNTTSFLPDGSWADRTASGTWTTRKNRLTLVTTRALDAGGRWATLASPVTRIEKVRVQTPDRIASATRGGARRVLDRCPSSEAEASKPSKGPTKTTDG